MINKVKITFLLGIFLCLSAFSKAQIKQGELVDGIAAVIGDEIILDSDITEQINYAKQQGVETTDKCEFMESLLSNKLLVYEAKRDTLIESRSAQIKEGVEGKYKQIAAQFPDEKAMLDLYKFRNAFEMKNALEKIENDNYYGQAKMQRITDKMDVTPNEVTDFFNMYKTQFPEIKDEVTIAQIMMYPELTEAHKQELIDRLKKIKTDIQKGESFESQARIYSEDPGSAPAGGLMKNIYKGQMVKPFEAAALNLQEGEISEPVETEFGFHIIQLVKKSGKMYEARHILLKAVPTAEEIKTTEKKLDSIKTLVTSGKMTFKDAAFKFSNDKRTKFNGGLIAGNDGSNKIERASLPGSISYELAGLNKGDITVPFEDVDDNTRGEAARKVVKIVKIEDVIPQHTMTLESDYDRIKQYALRKKQNEAVEKWVNTRIPSVFISLDKRYKDCNFKSDWKKGAISK